ncbi:MAG: FAD-dependent oxidoreductase [Burkholderiaceae bacterium]
MSDVPKTIREPARDVPVIAEPDVLVVGGGPAGIGAACAAARAGARTLLVESYGCLGGTLTIVTLGGLCGVYAVRDDAQVGRVVGGLLLELEDRLAAVDAIRPPKRHGRIIGVPYDSVRLKGVLDEMTAAHGVDVLLHTSAVAVTTEGRRVAAVLVENKGGRGAIVPRVVVDASGDGDVAVRAGARYTVGDAQGDTQFGSAMFRLGGVDTARAGELTRTEIRDCLERAVAQGYPLPRTATGVHVNPIEGVAHLNVTKLGRPDGSPFDLAEPRDLGDAEREGRRQVRMYEEAFRRFVPGFERARVIDIGARVGARETRLVRGEKLLTEAQVRGCAKPDDRIACSAWPLEEHGRGRATAWDFLPDGQWYGVPWGCLVVQGFDNLLVAGRNLSAEHAAQASVRVAGPCLALGEAAGLGAAASLAAGGDAHAVDVTALQTRLRAHGAILEPAWA